MFFTKNNYNLAAAAAAPPWRRPWFVLRTVFFNHNNFLTHGDNAVLDFVRRAVEIAIYFYPLFYSIHSWEAFFNRFNNQHFLKRIIDTDGRNPGCKISQAVALVCVFN